MNPTVGRIVHCWPKGLEAKEGKGSVECAALICGVDEDTVSLHYFLPDGANGAQTFPKGPSGVPHEGRWWWPPRA